MARDCFPHCLIRRFRRKVSRRWRGLPTRRSRGASAQPHLQQRLVAAAVAGNRMRCAETGSGGQAHRLAAAGTRGLEAPHRTALRPAPPPHDDRRREPRRRPRRMRRHQRGQRRDQQERPRRHGRPSQPPRPAPRDHLHPHAHRVVSEQPQVARRAHRPRPARVATQRTRGGAPPPSPAWRRACRRRSAPGRARLRAASRSTNPAPAPPRTPAPCSG